VLSLALSVAATTAAHSALTVMLRKKGPCLSSLLCKPAVRAGKRHLRFVSSTLSAAITHDWSKERGREKLQV
jgi:hypothetical protein